MTHEHNAPETGYTDAEQAAWRAGIEAGREIERNNAVVGQEPVAVLRREIGESDWFDHTPVRPGSAEHDCAALLPEWDYCPVYAAPVAAQAQPWQHLAAAVYQACGAYDMPTRVLDVLSAAANGEPFEHLIDGLLPVEAPAQQPVSGADGLTPGIKENNPTGVDSAAGRRKGEKGW